MCEVGMNIYIEKQPYLSHFGNFTVLKKNTYASEMNDRYVVIKMNDRVVETNVYDNFTNKLIVSSTTFIGKNNEYTKGFLYYDAFNKIKRILCITQNEYDFGRCIYILKNNEIKEKIVEQDCLHLDYLYRFDIGFIMK
jgi:hypothetical protein